MSNFWTRAALLVILVLGAAYGLDAAGTPGWVGRVPQLVLAAVGTAWAARQFAPADPPRRGWMLLSFVAPLALIIGPVIGAELRLGGLLLGPILIVIANLLLVTGTLSLLRVLHRSGLAPAWTRGWTAGAIVSGLATLAVGAAVVLNLEVPALDSSLDAHTWSVRRIVGVAADIIVFNTAIQMVRITLPMRRGLVATPYLLLAVTAALYMTVVLGLAITSTLLQTELGMVGRLVDTLAWCCLGLAGFAQARTVRRSRAA